MKQVMTLLFITSIMAVVQPGDAYLGKLNKEFEITRGMTPAERAYNGKGREQGNHFLDGDWAAPGEMVFAKAYYPDFNTAKLHAVTEIMDGDPLWVYIKTAAPLEALVTESEINDCADGSAGVRKTFTLAVGSKSEDYDSEWIVINKGCIAKGFNESYNGYVDWNTVNLKGNELIISLVEFKRKQSLAVLLEVLTEGSAGIWNNSIRVYGKDNPKPIAEAVLTCNVKTGFQKYKKSFELYKELERKGVPGDSKLPVKGTFNDAKVRKLVLDAAKEKLITPTEVYFANNRWTEYDNGERSVLAVIKFKKGNECLFETLEVWAEQLVTGAYGEPFLRVPIKSGLAVTCQ